MSIYLRTTSPGLPTIHFAILSKRNSWASAVSFIAKNVNLYLSNNAIDYMRGSLRVTKENSHFDAIHRKINN
jgi:hypothetical protein